MAISFETKRLKIVEVASELAFSDRSVLLDRVPKILTPSVVKNLPAYFHEITSSELAEIWLDRMLLESRLFQVKSKKHEVIGFLFAFVEQENYAHIGYLLAEEYWGLGLATELLESFIGEVAKTESWLKLIGGVDQSNVVSANLLKKLGFIEQPINNSGIAFYVYTIPQSGA